MRHFLIDTDVGSNIDDLLALALALEFGSISVEGITTVGTDAVKRQRLAERLLSAADMPNIPVAAGQELPIGREASQRFRSFNGHGIDLASDADPPAHSAIRLILSLAMSSPGLVIVALGPLTNLAMALGEQPAPLRRIRHLFIMGGSAYPGSAQLQFSDYNFASDAEAARFVLHSGLPITIVPLHFGDAVQINAELSSGLERRSDRLGRLLGEAAKDYLESTGSATARLCDVVTMAIALSPQLAVTRTTRMVTAATHDNQGASVKVVTDVSRRRLGDLVHTTLLRST